MPDYVWAVHDFVPEHEDEIDFRSGDRIEILERDDQYSDGWWQGMNPAGKAGLFPQSYTSPTPPDIPQSARNPSTTGLQTLPEADEAQEDSSAESGGRKPDSAVMTATMTDVQAAIDQLDNQSEARSFSFASTKEESDDPLTDSDVEHDNDDSWRVDARRALAERAMREMERREQQEAAAAPIRASLPPIDAEISDESDAEDDHDRTHVLDGTPRTTTFPSSVPPPALRRMRTPTPPPEPKPEPAPVAVPTPAPIPVVQPVLPPREPTPEPPQQPVKERTPSPSPVRPSTPARSDRSAPFASSHSREASVLSPPTPNSDASPSARGSLSAVAPQPMSMPSPVTMPIPAPAPALYSPPSIVALAAAMPLPSSPVPEDQPLQRSSGIRTSGGYGPLSAKASRPTSGTTTRTHSYTGPQPERSYTPIERSITERPPSQYQAPPPPQLQPVYQPELRTSTDIPASLPSPAASSFDARVGPRYSSATTTSSAPRASTAVTSPQSSLFNNPNAGVHPSEWSVDQVVAWLRARGFDDSVCDKFAEQEISGDVLLELDATVLKDEIGIVQFGKRMRIANAIQDLHRPPSVVSSENSGSKLQQLQQMGQHPHQHQLPPQQPQAYSNGRHSNGNGTSVGYGTSPLVTNMISPESPPHSGDIIYTPDRRIRPESEPGSAIAPQIIQPAGYGLGFNGGHARTDSTASGQPPSVMYDRSESIHRSSNSNGHSLGVRQPNSLTFSPSDGALNKRAALADQILEDLGGEERVQERAAMSEGEIADGLEARTSKRRNKSSDPPPAQFQFDAPGSRKSKTSVDIPPPKHSPTESSSPGGGGSRLSFFGGGNKTRKPPPRVGTAEAATENTDPPAAAPSRNLSTRLHFGSTNKRPSSRAGSSPTNTNVAPVAAAAPPATLRKRTMSAGDSNASSRGKINLKPGMSIIDQIGEADYSGWMRKRGERYNTWKLRYFVLKGPHLYYLRSRNETKLKGYINIVGYKVIADENANPGRYGFRIVHETDKPHYFSSEEQMVVREWMKAVMKATIDRDYTRPVISSCNIPTIPLTIAQAMNPAPRPPSPAQRDATQRAMRRDNPNQLSSRDARVLMGLPDGTQGPAPSSPPMDERKRLESFFSVESGSTGGAASPPISPVSPTRPKRRTRTSVDPPATRSALSPEDEELVKWINSHLPNSLHVTDLAQSLATGLVLFRLAEAIKGRAVGVPDSVFPRGPNDDRLEGLFKLFDFLLDNEIRTGNVSINDVRQGRRDKIVQLVKALKTWEEKRLAVAKSVGVGAVVAGPWAS